MPARWLANSAGRRMTHKVPTARLEDKLLDVHKRIERNIKQFETVHYVYVLDNIGKLTGVLSSKDLYTSSKTKKVKDVCKKQNLVMVKPWQHQERVAYLALRHNVKAVPVVDADHTFLGVIPSDEILRILYHETHEDLMRKAGIHAGHDPFDNVLTMSLWQSFKHRIPWLFIGLLGGIFAAQIIGFFEQTLEHHLILAAFIPLIVYMGGAVATQMETFIIRDIAVDHDLPFFRYVLKQLMVIFCIAALFSLSLFAIGSLLYGSPHLSGVLAASMFGAIVSSVFTGLLVPYLFHRLRMDPANASGPMATIIQDIMSIVIYFSVASMLL